MPEIAASRLGYVDTIKGLVIAGVIVAHAAMAYGLVGVWPYRETATWALPLPLAIVFGGAVTVGMGILFLAAGLFTPAAAERKGARRFAASRLRRLGVPVAVYLLALMPALNFAGRWASGDAPGAAALYALDRLRQLDVGPTWFLLALLLFTFLYMAWRTLHGGAPAGRAVGGRQLAVLAVLAATGMAAVRLVQPATELAPINFTVWPQDLALFAAGAAVGRPWLERIPTHVVRSSIGLTVAGAAALLPLGLQPAQDVADVAGGWHWQSAVFCLGESLFTVGITILLFRLFQRIAAAPLRRYTSASFTAYLVQAPVVLALGIALGPSALPPALKFLAVAAAALVLCFGLGAAREEANRRRRGTGRLRAAAA